MQINTNGNIFDSLKNTATEVGGNLKNAQNSFIDAIKSGDQAKIATEQINFQQKQAVFAALSEMAKAIFDTIMQIIRKLSLS